ncbi:M23 family metallopeptidase [uncultured Kriegella sp.]|uniref:M23 family metallopeptidase n=1 Tax=uncultured Kriegella sp. TaxID=1798910 RepID=UPI0030D704B9|tara:strand:- start:124894 stop:125823 length:930 start_codon:yes stop_codon:yes gene_type:complete
MVNLIFCLVLAGITAGLVNYFYTYLSLPTEPTKKDDSVKMTETGKSWGFPALTWQLALTGYIIIGIAGSMLTPLLDAIVGLKGIDAKFGENLLVVFGYGLVFGFTTNQIITSISTSILKKVEKLFADKQRVETFSNSLNNVETQIDSKELSVCPNSLDWEKAPNYEAKPLTNLKWANNLSKDKFGCSRNGGTKFHAGIDLHAPVASECFALFSGTITDVGYGNSLGKYIALQFIKHGKPYGAGYCHLSEVKVKKGDIVNSGQVIGLTGTSGNVGDDKPHLHLEIHRNKWRTYSSTEKRSKAALDPNHYV